MKKYFLLIIAISLIAFQACKKDNELTDPNRTAKNSSTETTEFNPNKIENINEYLSGFMKDIKTANRNAETMSIEEAEWHLSACLNYLYCNVNVLKTHIVYDTIVTTITTNNGYVTLNDINTSLQEISTEVANIYNSSEVENKNLLFIKPEILDETLRSGNTVKTIVATSGNRGDHYYFTDWEFLGLDTLLVDNSLYQWNTDAIDTLHYLMNMFMPEFSPSLPGRYFSIVRQQNKFDKNDYGRMFYGGNPNQKLTKEQILFYLDYYLYIIDANKNVWSYIASDIKPSIVDSSSDKDELYCYYHILSIEYGDIYIAVEDNPGIFQ